MTLLVKVKGNMATQKVAQTGYFIGEIFREAWALFKKEWITIYAVQLLPLAIAIVYTFGLEQISMEQSTYGFVWPLLYMVVQFIVSMGVIKAYLEISRNKKVTLETFTSVANLSLKYIAAQFLLMFIVLGGFLLFIVPGIIFSLKFMFAPYLVIDKGMGPIEALKASSKITDGIKWDLVGFLGAAVVLMYSGILALFVGLIITIPVATVSYILLYNRAVKRLEA